MSSIIEHSEIDPLSRVYVQLFYSGKVISNQYLNEHPEIHQYYPSQDAVMKVREEQAKALPNGMICELHIHENGFIRVVLKSQLTLLK